MFSCIFYHTEESRNLSLNPDCRFKCSLNQFDILTRKDFDKISAQQCTIKYSIADTEVVRSEFKRKKQ